LFVQIKLLKIEFLRKSVIFIVFEFVKSDLNFTSKTELGIQLSSIFGISAE